MGGMAHGLRAAWYGVIGLGCTIVTFSVLLFTRSGIRHVLISIATLCVWLTVLGAIFNQEIRYAVNPGSFGSYGYATSNKTDDWIGGELVGTSADERTVMTAIINMRPKYQSWLGGAGSSLWQFNADTHITDWLEAMGYDFDCVTDDVDK